MRKITIMKYAIAFLLLFCIENSTLFPQAEESWIKIGSSYDELEGEWEGTAISPVRIDINNKTFESRLNISMVFNYKKGDTLVSSFVKIDFAEFLTDLVNTDGMKERGYTRENIWELYKNSIRADGIRYNQYSLIVDNKEPAGEFFASGSTGKFFKNENQDALLLVYYEPSFILGIGDLGFTKMIFKKIGIYN
jgi:hypothetical protein